MRTKKDLVTDTLEKYNIYIEDLYNERDALRRKKFINETMWKDFVPVIEDDTARFLQVMLEMKRPMKILEIGTSIGFSATSMAFIAKKYGGRITTIEFDKTAYEEAKKNFEKAGVDNVIEIMFGDATKIISKLKDESFDFIFQDVDKRLYPNMLKDCIRILNKGGIFIADDVLFPVMKMDDKYSNQIEPIERFNKLVVDSVELQSTLLPIGDGIIVSVKR